MYTYFNRFGRSTKDGVEILRYKITLPEFESMDSMTRFYLEIADSVKKFCDGDLVDYAEKRFEESSPESRKFRYPTVVYTLEGSVTYEDDENLFVKLEARLFRKGDKNVIRSYDAHGWTKSDERLMPPWIAARLFIPKGRLPPSVKRARGVYYSEGRLFVCGESGIEEITQSIRPD